MLRTIGDAEVRARVEAALRSGVACWCSLVQLELWNGARGGHERRVLRDFASSLPELAIDTAVWDLAYDLAKRARGQGVTVPATDILIASCARRHGADLEFADRDFELLASVQ